MNPVFSIIVPVYKVEKYIKECIESVLGQDYHEYELILVDDGSPDCCPAICDKYASEHQDTIKTLHKQNGGLSDARNFGTENAKGQYIIYLDSDDYWTSKVLLRELASAIEHFKYPDLVLFQGKKYFETNGKIVEDAKYDLAVINHATKDVTIEHLIKTQSYSMSACTKAVKREFLVANNIQFEKGLLGEDLDWFFQVIMQAKVIRAINNSSYFYRIREGSISTSQTIKNEEDQLYIINKWRKVISESSISDIYKKYYFSILAYAYMVALLNYGKLSASNKKLIFPELKRSKGILRYAENHRVKVTYHCSKMIGLRLTASLLNLYRSHVIRA